MINGLDNLGTYGLMCLWWPWPKLLFWRQSHHGASEQLSLVVTTLKLIASGSGLTRICLKRKIIPCWASQHWGQLALLLLGACMSELVAFTAQKPQRNQKQHSKSLCPSQQRFSDAQLHIPRAGGLGVRGCSRCWCSGRRSHGHPAAERGIAIISASATNTAV